MPTADHWRRLRSLYPRSRSAMTMIVVLSMANAALLIPAPLVVQYILDDAVPSMKTPRLVGAGSLLAALLIGSELTTLARRAVAAKHGKAGIERLRLAMLAKMHDVPVEHLRRTEPDEIHDRVVLQTTTIDTMVQAILTAIVPTVVLAAGLAGVILAIDWIVFVIALLVVPTLYGTYRFFQPRMQERESAFDSTVSRLSASVMYSLRSIELTRGRGTDKLDMARNEARLAETRTADIASQRIRGVYRSVERSAVAVFGVVVLVALGISSSRGDITSGELVAVFFAVGILALPATLTLAAIPATKDGVAALREVMTFLEADYELPYAGTGVPDAVTPVVLDNVAFSYGTEPVLTNASLTLEPGTVTMVTGPNGSGKSSLISLVVGFFRPVSGTVSAGGVPLDELDMQLYRHRIGLVAQDPIIVSGTIADNIRYGMPEATDVDLWQAAHLATVDDFIVDFEDGYSHRLTFGGRTLSGGQRQRVAIARALIRNPELLILDEPTSYLDAGTLRRIIANLKRLPEEPAVFITSHRPRVVDKVDRLYHLEGRQIIRDSVPAHDDTEEGATGPD